MSFNINFDIKWIIIPVTLIIVSFLGVKYYQNNISNKRLEVYNRQLSGDLNELEEQLQGAHYELGVSKSKLVTQKELAKRLKKDNEEVDEEFEKLKKEHSLIVKKRDRTIAGLKQQLEGGVTEVIVSED